MEALVERSDVGLVVVATAHDSLAAVTTAAFLRRAGHRVCGKKGKIDITGLGGSYGVERLSWYRMLPEMGPPETTIWEYPMADDSWENEMGEFLEDIRLDRQPSAGLADAQAALRVIEEVYRVSGM